MTKINLNRCLSYEKRWDTSVFLQEIIDAIDVIVVEIC